MKKVDFNDLAGLFGMMEMEAGIADLLNLSCERGVKLSELCFLPEDLTSDRDAFEELRENGWLMETVNGYRLISAAVARVRTRFPEAQ